MYLTAMNEVKQCIEDNWDRIQDMQCHHKHLYDLFERMYRLDLEHKEEIKRIEN